MKKIFSIIVPFYNEQNICQNYKTLSSYLKKNISAYELILVSDGSSAKITKPLGEIIKNDPNAKLIHYPINEGRGYAVMQGFKNSSGDYLAYIDADLEIAPKYLAPLFEKLKKNDVSIANKFHPNSKVITPFIRRLSSRLFNTIIQIGLGSKIKDHQVGLKGFRRKAIQKVMPHITEKRWLFDLELLYLLQKKKFSVIDIPIEITYGFKKIQGSFIIDFLKLFAIMFYIRKKHKNIIHD